MMAPRTIHLLLSSHILTSTAFLNAIGGNGTRQSYFGSNVYAIMEGVKQVALIDYNFLAVLDADITLPGDYYEQILARFAADPRLGVASGIYENLVNGQLQRVINDRRSTPKAIQVFRRSCFEQIGGYVPMKYGGEDACACTMARMHGWKSWSFPELKVIHRRPTGLGNARSILRPASRWDFMNMAWAVTLCSFWASA